jgi:2-polyprenyl-3-methyl-5-hydroxy-6-metoxy-1,4-benzoquinol methylase
MNETPAPSPLLFFDTINAYQKSAALRAAIEIGLFSAVGPKGATLEELVQRCDCPDRGVRILADYMTILGFLVKADGRYTLTADSAAFLVKDSPAYLGNTIEFFHAPALVQSFDTLSETIRAGKKTDAGTTAEDHAVWVRFANAMAPLMMLPARSVAELVSIPQDRPTKVLDISASHGVYGITFAQKNPQAHLVALDWEAVLAVTERNARAAGIGERFSKIVGSAFTADLGRDYDAILIPNFLHHFSEQECTAFLQRAQATLKPGGVLVIVEFVPNEDRITPPATAGFGIVMLGTTPEGDAYTFADYRRMLAAAGFSRTEHHPLPPTAQSAVLAWKA